MEYQLVIFRLGNESFGVNITNVESIIKMQSITHLPNTKDCIEGITNLRGKILPVIDLCKRLGLPSREVTKESRIIVVAFADSQAGMIVDEVSEVYTVSEEVIEPTPPIVVGVNSSMITGIAKVGPADDQHAVILLDLEEVLSISEKASMKRIN